MNFIGEIFNLILYQPLFNLLILLYQWLPIHDFGIAIIVLTLFIRLILYPSTNQALRSQMALSRLQPKVQEIQKRYKGDLAKQSQAILALYRQEKINPLSGIFPLLIQFPILIALFYVFQTFKDGLSPAELSLLYRPVSLPTITSPLFLGVLNLAQPSFFLAILAGFFQYLQQKMFLPAKLNSVPQNPQGQFSQVLQKQMTYFFPILTVFILLKLPAALGLYWLSTTLFSIFQQHLIFKKEYARAN
jgi:YidC/Oxa1 family membrane protein insertase